MRSATNSASAALVLFLAAGAVATTSAQECSPVVLSQLFEEVVDVAIDGDVAAVANGDNGLLILDVSTPSSPVAASAVSLPTNTTVVAVSLPFVYSIGDDGVLRCFDVTVPSAPVARGSITVASSFQATQLAVVGDTVFVLAASNFTTDDFRSVSFADPDSPSVLDGIELADRGRGLAINGGIAVIAQEGTSALLVDVSNPAAMTEISTLPVSFSAFDAFAAATSTAAVVSDNDDFNFTGGYRVFDISDPQNPLEVFSDFSVGYITDLAAEGDTLYVSGDQNISIIDLSTPSAPVQLGSVSWVSQQPSSLAADDGVLLQGRSSPGVLLSDVSNPASPVQLSEYNPGITSGYQVVLDGDTAFVAEIGTLWSVDISDRMNPVILDSLSGLGGAPSLALAGDTLYYGTSFSSLGTRIIDVSNPSNLINTGRLTGSDSSPSVVDGFLYTRTGAGYVVYDITNPLTPVQVATFPAPAGFGGQLAGRTALGVAVGSSNGIALFNISDPFNASAYTTLDTPGFANHAAVETGYVYVSDGTPGMQVVDVANPVAPSIVSALDTPSFTKRVTLDETFAYISQSLGVVLADISDPLSPQMITEFRNFGQFSVSQPNDVAVVDDIAVIAEQFNGLLLVDFSTCTTAPPCPGDIADDFGTLGGDGMVSFGDFLALLGLVGSCPGGVPGCDGDIADDFGTLGGDGMVSFGDFLALLGLVGPCP